MHDGGFAMHKSTGCGCALVPNFTKRCRNCGVDVDARRLFCEPCAYAIAAGDPDELRRRQLATSQG